MNTLYSKLCKGISILTILLFVLLSINFILRLNGRILFFETWTPMDSHVILGASALLSLTVFLVFRLTYLVTKIIVVFIVIIITSYIFFLGMLGSVNHVIYEKEGYEVNVFEWRSRITGHDTYFVKENFLTSVYIGVGEQSEKVNSTYYIEDGVFHIVEYLGSGAVINHSSIPLPNP